MMFPAAPTAGAFQPILIVESAASAIISLSALEVREVFPPPFRLVLLPVSAVAVAVLMM